MNPSGEPGGARSALGRAGEDRWVVEDVQHTGGLDGREAGGGFAARLRASTQGAHREAEASRFLDDLLAGRLDTGAHVALLAQHHPVYEVLEEAARAHRRDPVVGAVLDDALLRLPSLEADLRHLEGEGWREALVPTAATRRYVERLRAVVLSWPGGFVAHHYLRYLGDLSGGQIMRRLLGRAYGYTREGLRFYTFDGIPRPKPFKDRYRALLDAAPWSVEEQDRIIAEVDGAYRLNRDLFADLDAASGAWRRQAGAPPEDVPGGSSAS